MDIPTGRGSASPSASRAGCLCRAMLPAALGAWLCAGALFDGSKLLIAFGKTLDRHPCCFSRRPTDRRWGTRCRHGRAGSIPLRELVFSRAASLNCCRLQRVPIPLPGRGCFLFIAVALVLPTSVGSRISALLIPLVLSCLCEVFLPSVPHGAGLWEALKGQASLCLLSKHRRCRSPALCQGCRKRSRPPAFFLLFSSPAARSRQELWDLKPFCLAVGVGSHPLLPGNSTSFARLLTEAVSAVSVHA